MRMLLVWDGSGHALQALRGAVSIFRQNSIEHIEIVLAAWPPRDNAMWADIRQQQVVVDDAHRAAAEVLSGEGQQLRDVLGSFTESIAVSIVNGPVTGNILDAIAKTRADILFVLVGTYDPTGVIRQTIEDVEKQSPIPTWLLRAPGQQATLRRG